MNERIRELWTQVEEEIKAEYVFSPTKEYPNENI
jgi:hypothetical protein